MFYCKTYKWKKDFLVAVCDKEIINREFLFNDIIFKTNEEFYGKEIHTEEDIKEILSKATIINAVGKNIIELLIKEDLIEKEKIIKIGETLHAQMVRL